MVQGARVNAFLVGCSRLQGRDGYYQNRLQTRQQASHFKYGAWLLRMMVLRCMLQSFWDCMVQRVMVMTFRISGCSGLGGYVHAEEGFTLHGAGGHGNGPQELGTAQAGERV